MSVTIESVNERLMQASDLCGMGTVVIGRDMGPNDNYFVRQQQLHTTFEVIQSLVDIAIGNLEEFEAMQVKAEKKARLQ